MPKLGQPFLTGGIPVTIEAKCEHCHKKVTVDTATLPKMNGVALKAALKAGDKTREVYVDCPHCKQETLVNVPLDAK